ncbi:MAG: hypothetical protein A3B68_08115 [Candidatus Melainabacteria bacterium RIFCSPHIGHO2_02_FULL_34_12]|nr:MAG: hypothetical protein A3B68_08115 [Candidatus Melainabacteria bacterium RIFCSPHIGHO2_02_FULL_34_12]
MQIKDVVKYFNTPTVQRGVITRPTTKGLRDLKVSDMNLEDWSNREAASGRNSRIPMSFGQIASIFAKSAARENLHITLKDAGTKQELSRAVMIALAFSRVKPNEDADNPDTLLVQADLNKFKSRLAHELVHNDFVPVYDKASPEDAYDQHLGYRTAIDIFANSYRMHSDFDRLTFSMKRDKISDYLRDPMFFRFVTSRGGRFTVHREEPNHFPGPGIVVEGLSASMFPDGALGTEYWRDHEENLTPPQEVKRRNRNRLVTLEDAIKVTTFGLFRGGIIIRNPDFMKIQMEQGKCWTAEPFSLIVFNDHFGNPNLEMAFLVADHNAEEFLAAPVLAMTMGTPLDPTKINTTFKDEVLNLTWTSNIGGMNRAVPVKPIKDKFFPGCRFLDKDGRWYMSDLFGHERIKSLDGETRDWDGHMHVTHMDKKYHGYWQFGFPLENLLPHKFAHDQISECANTGFALWKILMKAFDVYSYGYDYIPDNPNYKLAKPLRMLGEAMRWGMSSETSDNRPFLVPMTENGFSNALVEELGAVDTRLMICYRRNRGTFMLPNGHLEDIASATRAEVRDTWLKNFIVPAFNNNARLVFLPGNEVGPTIKNILGVGK